MIKNIQYIDSKTFLIVYDLYFSSLCRYLKLFSKDEQTIEDIVQDVFIKLWEQRDLVEIEYVKTYIFHMARNKILNKLRDQNNRNKLLEKWLLESERFEKTEESFNEINSKVKQAIDQLPPKCKEVFLLNRRDNLTYKQISEKLEISVKTVENQLVIAMKKLREILIINNK